MGYLNGYDPQGIADVYDVRDHRPAYCDECGCHHRDDDPRAYCNAEACDECGDYHYGVDLLCSEAT